MALIRWEPVRGISPIQNEMNRLFNSFFDTPTAASGNGGSAPAGRWIPAMDLAETEGEFVLKADLPGLSEGDVSIELEDDVLTVSGERKVEHEERIVRRPMKVGRLEVGVDEHGWPSDLA